MKKIILLFLSAWAMCVPCALAQHMFDYSDMRSGIFAQKSVYGVRSMNDGEHYTTMDGRTIRKFSYRTGEEKEVIFDMADHDYAGTHFGAYKFSPDERTILISTSIEPVYRHSFRAVHWLYDRAGGTLTSLTDVGGEQEACFDPEGSAVAYIKDNNIWLVSTETGAVPRQITFDGKVNEIINGHTDWVYEEEYGFTCAFEFSPDGKKIAYLRFDEREVPEFTMMVYGGYLYPEAVTFKYPKAGDRNSVVTLHVHDLESGETMTVDTGSDSDQYLPRIAWTPDGKLFFYRVNRLQNHFEVLLADPQGRSEVIYSETDRRYVERPDESTLTFVDKDRFIVRSETSGFSHLYLHRIGRGVTDTLTRGRWDVTALVEVTKDRVYYLSTEESPLRRSLYSVKLNGKGKTKLTAEEGVYRIAPSEGFRYFISYFSNTTTPNLVRLHDSSGKVLRVLEDNAALVDNIRRYKVPTKEFFTFTTMQGTVLNGYMVRPLDFDERKTYPVLLSQYSGPGSQQVLDSWSLDWTDLLVQEGYIVVSVDGRGTGGRGADFRKCTYGNLGGLETEDQIETAKYLATLPWVDRSRIGIYGWSFGGFMALNCILKGADNFKTAVAVAPVTSWRFYDTIYTEIYNGLPQDNPRGYDDNSPINFADRLRGNVLIVHGTADDNVHVQNTYLMADALVKAGKQFDMALYPDDNHGMLPGGRHHIMERMIEYVKEKL